MTEPSLTGVGHIALSVKDLPRAVAWYGEVLGFQPLFPFNTDDFDRQILMHPSGAFVALTRHHHPDADEDFNERRPGLDHLAFSVQDVAALEAWADRLDALGWPHSGVSVTPVTGSALLAFRDPDGIALELYVQVGMPEGL
jgi:glyoxylase I family protein